jgi:hypothetical protein
MKPSFVLRSLVVVGAVVGFAGCAGGGGEESETAEGAIDKDHKTFDINFGGRCVGNETPQVRFTVNFPWRWVNTSNTTVPADFVLKDPSQQWKEIARAKVTLKKTGSLGKGQAVVLDLPKDLPNPNLKLELRTDFEALGFGEASEQFRDASQIVEETTVDRVTSVCSWEDLTWSEDLRLDVNEPTEETAYAAAVATLTSKGFQNVSRATITKTDGCGETGFPLAGKASVLGRSAGRLVIVYKRHAYRGKKAPYRILTVDRNFGSMGRDSTFDIPKGFVDNQSGEFEDVIAIAIATFDSELKVSLVNPDCSK